MSASLGVCGAFRRNGRCGGTLIIDEQQLGGALLEATCDSCGAHAAMPVGKIDPGARTARRLQHAGLPERFVGKRFEEDLENRPALEAIRAWIAGAHDGLIPAPALFGEPGVGKSHLLSAIAVRLIRDLDREAAFYAARGLLRLLQRFEHQAEREKTLERASTVGVLVLDDLGAQQSTDWRMDVIADLIDVRYERELPIVLATNYPPSMWAQMLDERSASRLRGICFPVELRGPDRRTNQPTEEER